MAEIPVAGHNWHAMISARLRNEGIRDSRSAAELEDGASQESRTFPVARMRFEEGQLGEQCSNMRRKRRIAQ